MLYQPLVLRAAAAASSSGAISESFTRINPRLWACTVVGAAVLSLAALMQAAVGGRIDRAYLSMARAFIQRGTTPEEPHGRHRLKVVQGRGKAAP